MTGQARSLSLYILVGELLGEFLEFSPPNSSLPRSGPGTPCFSV
jgi:hypothetical protein